MLDIRKINYGDLIGLGESSHGTLEFQKIRLNIIKYLHGVSPIQVFIEANYVAIELTKVPNIGKKAYIKIIHSSSLYPHLKSKAFCEILWYLYSNKIPYYGVDVQIHPQEEFPHPLVQWIKEYNGDRDSGMQEMINILWDRTLRGVFLAHNYHISDYVKFPGTKVGFATLYGTVNSYDDEGNPIKNKFDYNGQGLAPKSDQTIIKTKKWFYSIGTTMEPRDIYSGDKFDYIIFIRKTSALL